MSINLNCFYIHKHEEYSICLIDNGVVLANVNNLPEDADVKFVIKVKDDKHPILKLADVPIDLKYIDDLTYESHYDNRFNENKSYEKVYKNFIGESRVSVICGSKIFNCKVNVLSTEENIELASEMLDFLDSKSNAMASLCFSKSFVNSGGGENNKLTITAILRCAEKCILDFENYWPLFIKQIKSSGITDLKIIKGGVPNSNDAINWLSMHQSNIEFCNRSEQMFTIRGRGAKTDNSAVEFIKKDTLNNENLAVLSFLYHLISKLNDLKVLVLSENKSDGNDFSGYFSLDHVINRYKKPLIDQMENDINLLINKAVFLNKYLMNILNVRQGYKHVMPIVTPFVANNSIYRHYFQLMHEWYNLSENKISNDFNQLSSFRNLSTIYEICTILTINDVLCNIGFDLVENCYRDYSSPLFGGIDSIASDYQINNYFNFKSNGKYKFSIKLYYEPKIWRHNNANNGDPIVISRKYSKKANYYRCPDFVMKIEWDDCLKDSDLIIMDAKFKPACNVKNYDMSDLIEKYYLGIHQIRNDGKVGRKPVQAVWALFPKKGWKFVKNDIYSDEHQINGLYPVLPSFGGIKLRPKVDNTDKTFEDSFISLLDLL